MMLDPNGPSLPVTEGNKEKMGLAEWNPLESGTPGEGTHLPLESSTATSSAIVAENAHKSSTSDFKQLKRLILHLTTCSHLCALKAMPTTSLQQAISSSSPIPTLVQNVRLPQLVPEANGTLRLDLYSLSNVAAFPPPLLKAFQIFPGSNHFETLRFRTPRQIEEYTEQCPCSVEVPSKLKILNCLEADLVALCEELTVIVRCITKRVENENCTQFPTTDRENAIREAVNPLKRNWTLHLGLSKELSTCVNIICAISLTSITLAALCYNVSNKISEQLMLRTAYLASSVYELRKCTPNTNLSKIVKEHATSLLSRTLERPSRHASFKPRYPSLFGSITPTHSLDRSAMKASADVNLKKVKGLGASARFVKSMHLYLDTLHEMTQNFKELYSPSGTQAYVGSEIIMPSLELFMHESLKCCDNIWDHENQYPYANPFTQYMPNRMSLGRASQELIKLFGKRNAVEKFQKLLRLRETSEPSAPPMHCDKIVHQLR
jgi:hypothetical protein